MRRLSLLLLSVLDACACAYNPGLEMWDSNDRGARNTCMPFAPDGGVGSGVVTGAPSFTAAGAHQLAYSPRPATAVKFLQVQLDEGGTSCHLSSQSAPAA